MDSSRTVGSRGRSRGRQGFTLVELLVVMVIIGILAALLFPAVMGALSGANHAEVVNEIKQLETAIVAFKQKYGVEPPSRIVLSESPTSWQLRSKGKIIQIWPQFDFSKLRDINGDGDSTDSIILTGAECLVFFLGGVPNATDRVPVGFSKNPRDPFSLPNSPDATREGPFFEFEAGRLIDLDDDRMPELIDPLPAQEKPYLYLSSYNGRGYDLAELSGSGMTSVYMQTADTAWRPKTYQIISPGKDSEFGPGGIFNASTADADLVGSRKPERDNITNFHSGTLAD